MWVREQFTADRMEVNVVGDFDEHNLLRQLNHILGTMPLSRRQKAFFHKPNLGRELSPRSPDRIGYDIYNKSHESVFSLRLDEMAPVDPTQPLHFKSITNCTLVSSQPGRAFLALGVLMTADFSSVRGHQKSLLADATFQQTLLNALRRDGGYVFSVESQSFTSMVFRRFGFYELQWVVGIEDNSEGQEQINSTLTALGDILSSPVPFDEETFNHAKQSMISSLEGQLQESHAWLSVLQGLSLAPPIWQKPAVFDTIKDISQTDVLGGMIDLTLKDINDFFAQHIGRAFPVHVAYVETISSDTVASKLGGTTCKWQWKE